MTTTPAAIGFKQLVSGDLLVFDADLFSTDHGAPPEIWWTPSGRAVNTMLAFLSFLQKNPVTTALVVEPRGFFTRDKNSAWAKKFWAAEVLVGENKYVLRIAPTAYCLEAIQPSAFKVCRV